MKEDILAMYLAAVNPLGKDVWTWLTKVEILKVEKDKVSVSLSCNQRSFLL